MKAFTTITDAFSRWIDLVAAIVAHYLERWAPPSTIKLTEDKNGEFVLENDKATAGANAPLERIRFVDGRIDDVLPNTLSGFLSSSRIVLTLRSDRFLFRPLELPARAAEFLEGIVRAQIDRLTPWNVADAAFGWSKPTQSATDRVMVTVAATASSVIKPFVSTLSNMGALSVAVFTPPPEAKPDAAAIKVWDERRSVLDIARIRRLLVLTLAISGLGALAMVAVSEVVGASLDAQDSEIARRISTLRAAVGAPRDTDLRSIAAGRRALERRKYETPSSVLGLESLSQILPDHTYVTELRVEGGKLRLVGVTRDAPSLIGLLEQSGHFTRATFFGPTVRLPSDQSERFHIEAVMQPLGLSRS